jgi:hypothetical protein
MSSPERSAWIRLVSILIVFTPYFAYVLHVFQRDGMLVENLLAAFVVAWLCQAAVNGIAEAAVRLSLGNTASDERDAVIDAQAVRIGYFSLVGLLMGALGTAVVVGVVSGAPGERLQVKQAFLATSEFVFFCIVAAEVLRYGTQVFCYRRGI